MKSVYVAQHSIDAHVVRGLLQSHDIDAIVTGDYLQGGIGELPAFGTVEVLVDDDDAHEARRIIQAFQSGDEPDAQLEA
ncbi:MAG: DUF2007 domain-containing protein [Proteobacteria bacterium]|nr:DUF2007 domain-containing protein [Pseudomonadota bacterium]